MDKNKEEQSQKYQIVSIIYVNKLQTYHNRYYNTDSLHFPLSFPSYKTGVK